MGLFDRHGQREVALPLGDARAAVLRAFADPTRRIEIRAAADEASNEIRGWRLRAFFRVGFDVVAHLDAIDASHTLVRIDTHQPWYVRGSVVGLAQQVQTIDDLLDAVAGPDAAPSTPRPRGAPRWPWAVIGLGVAAGLVAGGIWLSEYLERPTVAFAATRAHAIAHASLPAVNDLPGAGWAISEIDDFSPDQPPPTKQCKVFDSRAHAFERTLEDGMTGRAQITFRQAGDPFESSSAFVRTYVMRDLGSTKASLEAARALIVDSALEDCSRERLLDGGLTAVVSTSQTPRASSRRDDAATALTLDATAGDRTYHLWLETHTWTKDNAVLVLQVSGTPYQVTPDLVRATMGAVESRLTRAKDKAADSSTPPPVSSWARSLCATIDAEHAPKSPDVSKMNASQAKTAFVQYTRTQADRQSSRLKQLIALEPPAGGAHFQEGYLSALAESRSAYEDALLAAAGARDLDALGKANEVLTDALGTSRRTLLAAYRSASAEIAGVAQCLDTTPELAAWGAGFCTAIDTIGSVGRLDVRPSAILDAQTKTSVALKDYDTRLRREQSMLNARAAPSAVAKIHDLVRRALGDTIDAVGTASKQVETTKTDDQTAAILRALGQQIVTALDALGQTSSAPSPDAEKVIKLCS